MKFDLYYFLQRNFEFRLQFFINANVNFKF